MSKQTKIPEWVGSTLTNGAFLAYGDRVLAAYVAVGLDQINLTALGMKLTEALDAYRLAVKRQEAYDETVAVATADNDRDELAMALWHAWEHLAMLSPAHQLTPHVTTLRSEMSAYKGVWRHEINKESSELDGFRGALSTDANRAALAALGLDKIADALWAANDTVKSAQDSRADERQHRDDEKAGSTPELRKAVSTLLVQCANRVNAVYELDPDNDKAEQAIGKVIALIEEYKRVATEAKHRKGDDPEPEPEPAPEA